MYMANVKTLYTLNIKFISRSNDEFDDIIYDFYQFYRDAKKMLKK